MPRIAIVQAAPVGFDREATLDKAEVLVRGAAEHGAELVVLPEAFIGGYPKGAIFGAFVGGRTGRGFEEFGRYAEGASELPGPTSERLGEVAAEAGVVLVSGVIEREGGTLYSSTAILGQRGELIGVRRKLMPTGAERLIWGFADGSSIDVYETSVGRIGAVICWENYMPLLRAAMYQKGIQLYIAPTADTRERWIASMRHIALEGRCFVLSCGLFARRRDLPAAEELSIDEGSDERIIDHGGSCVISPLGEFVAGPVFDEEATIYADLDLSEVAASKYDFDPVGHYSRPDVFHLTVDVTPRRSVSRRCD